MRRQAALGIQRDLPLRLEAWLSHTASAKVGEALRNGLRVW
jgi:hypothetical protein